MSSAEGSGAVRPGPARAPRPLGPLDARSDHVWVPMRDGTRLATDVYLPGGPGPFPVVLTRLPYDKTARDCFIPWVAAAMVDRGYAFVAQDTRGKGRSEGETLAFVHERFDGWDTLEWLSRQRWCDGGVAMWGESYFGFTQWAAASTGHPALRAIVPRNTTSDVAGDWLHRQGVPKLGMPASWAADTWVDRFMYGIVPGELDWGARPLADVLASVHGDRRSASLDQWRARPHDHLQWRRSGLDGAFAASSAVPALHIGGWFDLFRRGQLADWRTSRRAGRAPQLLVMGATDHVHAEWSERPPGLVDLHGIPDAQIEAFMPRYLGSTFAFLGLVLGRADGPPAPAVRWELTRVGWREADRWPPAGARPLVLHLADGGRAGASVQGGVLVRRAEPAGRWIRWTHDPAEPVPSVVADELQSLAQPPDDRAVEGRPDVLTFTSSPLEHALDLAGPIAVELRAASTAPAAHVMAKLVEVEPSGVTRRISEGAAMLGAAGIETQVTIGLADTGYRVAADHALRLEIAGSDFPLHPPHPGTAADPWTATDLRAAELRVRVGGQDGARLTITVLP